MCRRVFAAALLATSLASCRSPGQTTGPYGVLELPIEYESHRISYRDAIPASTETVIAEMEGEGSLRHLWLTVEHLPERPELGLRHALRIYVDGSEVPSVDVPLGPFFGFHHGRAAVDVVSPYLTVTERGGFNAYFPMPYERGMKITVYNGTEDARGLWFQADYHRYRPGSLVDSRRFHATYRRVDRTERLGEPYHLGHSVGGGGGVIVGVSVGMRVFDRFDAWYHNGGDLLLIDGRTAGAHLISGIGGEDFFGTAWGQQSFSGGSVGSPYYDVAPEAGPEDPMIVFSGYRFFDRDPIAFRESFWYDFGTLANDVASVLYWYEAGDPVGAAAAADGGGGAAESTWNVCGPFPAERPGDFDRPEFPENEIDLRQTAPASFGQYQSGLRRSGRGAQPRSRVRWIPGVLSRHGFVDLTPHFRSRLKSNDGFPSDVSAYAATVIEASRQGPARFRVGHDDPFKLWINGDLVYRGGQLAGFQTREVEVTLRRGRNDILVKAANHDNTNFRAWVFSLDVLER